ncbi:MAG: hypothetical protein ACKODR_10225 [Acidimicrobiaceae bacterium]
MVEGDVVESATVDELGCGVVVVVESLVAACAVAPDINEAAATVIAKKI